MNVRERDALLEAAVTAHRDRDHEGRTVPPPAWFDLSPTDREELFRRQVASRALERAIDPAGQSGTARAVLARIMGLEI